MLSNKKLNPIVTELFISGRKLKLMIQSKIKNVNTILTEKQQKHQHYHQVKLINMNILQVKKYWHLIKVE